MKEECIFCNYKDLATQVYEDNLCYAVISKDPINKYHVLVIPKEHYEEFIELPDETAARIFLVSKKISKAIREVSKADAITHISEDDITKNGYNLVAHYKLHIFPRFKKDLSVVSYELLRGVDDLNARGGSAKEIRVLLS